MPSASPPFGTTQRPPAGDPARPAEADPLAGVSVSDSLRALAGRGTVRRLRKGAQIITEGDVGDTLYIVLSGGLRAYGAGSDVREVTYGEYGPGEYVGEMGLDGGPRSAHVEAMRATVCVVVTRATLERHLADDPQFAFELLAKVIRLARLATVSLKQISLNSVYGRLRALLDSLAVVQPDGTRVIDPAPSHLKMSQRLACTREMIGRVMKDLERAGCIERVQGRLVLRKPLPAKW